MIFNEWLYYLLLIVSVAWFFLVPKRMRRLVLVMSGIFFYGYYAKVYLLLIVVELVVVYVLTRSSSYKKTLVALLLTCGFLSYFKYRLFIAEIVKALTGFIQTGIGLRVGQMTVPLAISFFTFEFIHLVIEKNRGNIKQYSLTELAAFIFFFPTMIAGPIKRFLAFNGQIETTQFSPEHVFYGTKRILMGLFKKLVLADTLAAIVGDLLTSQTALLAVTSTRLWVAVFSYSWQIYFDFSGYSDIAIGSARLYGISIPENFERPYAASNIASFWKKWHQSLYRWLIDYVFIPLGGSRRGILPTCINTAVTMVISGLWHGAGLNFVVWGLYHALLLIAYRLYVLLLPQRYKFNAVIHIASITTTFTLVSLGWVFFVAPLPVAFGVLKKLF